MDLEFIKRIEQRGTAEIVEYPDDALLFCFSALEKIEDLEEENQQYLDCFAAMAKAALAVLRPKEEE
jgi:hypothetical protein